MADDDRTSDERTSAGKTSAKKTPAKKAPAKKTSAGKASDGSSAERPSRAGTAAKAEPSRRPGAGGIARQAAAQLHELTGHEIEGVTAVHRDGEGWVVEIDLLELRRVPATTDVIATYEVEVDDSGDLVGYRRQQRFVRGNVGEGR